MQSPFFLGFSATRTVSVTKEIDLEDPVKDRVSVPVVEKEVDDLVEEGAEPVMTVPVTVEKEVDLVEETELVKD